MGGSESKRRVIVEDAKGEDIVTISEAVVRRIQGQSDSHEALPESQPPAPPPSFYKPETSFYKPETLEKKASVFFTKDEEDFFALKLKELQERNSALQKLTNEEFAKAVKEVEEKFVRATSSPICQDLQLKVLECYQAHPTEVLHCASVVNAFTTCVDRARTNAWLQAAGEIESLL